MQIAFLTLLSIIAGCLRIAGVKSAAYQAVVHIFTGVLIGWGIGSKRCAFYWLAGAPSILEVACFFLFKYGLLTPIV